MRPPPSSVTFTQPGFLRPLLYSQRHDSRLVGLRSDHSVFPGSVLLHCAAAAEQRHGQMPVVLLGGHVVGVGDGVARDAVAPATAAATEYPGNGFPYNREEAVASALAHEAVEGGIGQAVEGGQQQRQVVIVEYSCRGEITDKAVPTTTLSVDRRNRFARGVPVMKLQSRSSRVRTSRKT